MSAVRWNIERWASQTEAEEKNQRCRERVLGKKPFRQDYH